MGGSPSGGLKTRAKLYAKNPDYYREIGALGGRVKNPNKGFGKDKRTFIQKLLRKPKGCQVAGKLGGTISRRRTA